MIYLACIVIILLFAFFLYRIFFWIQVTLASSNAELDAVLSKDILLDILDNSHELYLYLPYFEIKIGLLPANIILFRFTQLNYVEWTGHRTFLWKKTTLWTKKCILSSYSFICYYPWNTIFSTLFSRMHYNVFIIPYIRDNFVQTPSPRMLQCSLHRHMTCTWWTESLKKYIITTQNHRGAAEKWTVSGNVSGRV